LTAILEVNAVDFFTLLSINNWTNSWKETILASMSSFAAIDIGSNAIRLAIARQTNSGLHHSYRSREPVRLGRSVFGSGVIDEATYQELKQVLQQFRNQLENYNVLKYRAIATSAMREAANSREIIAKLREETGLLVEIISGDQEADLVATAISQRVDLTTGSYLLIDIGGGSIELVAMLEGQVAKRQSFVLGMVRVLELQKSRTEDLESWFPSFVEQAVAEFFEDLPPLKTAVGTGGNMDRFIKIKPMISTEPGMDLNFSQMQQVFQLLDEVSYEERISQFALKPDRADVIIPAAIATLEFMRLGSCETILFPQVGIKDGVLQELSSALMT
jgi:exopolyphosphatase/guanosine-5'-triphosphate,3'-diphosphate pyrophosphatase